MNDSQITSSSSRKSATLKIHEWLAVVTLILILGGLTLMAYLQKGEVNHVERAIPAFLAKSGRIEVMIEGAVDNAGMYYVPHGVSMRDVLMLAQPNSQADLRRFSLDAVLKKGRTIHVPSRQMINIQITGEVENSGEISVPKGTKLMDLSEYIHFSENANKKSIIKKRVLKNNEIIVIPKI